MFEKNKGSVTTGIIIAFTLYGFLSQYLFACIIAGIVLAIMIRCLWVPHLPPVLVYIFLYQFLQVFGAIVYGDFLNRPLELLFQSKDVSYLLVITLSQLGLMA